MKVLVIQPKIGMGDMVIYLPYIHAISKQCNKSISLMVKENSRAQELLADDEHVNEIILLDRNDSKNGIHDGITGFVRLVKLIKSKKFDKIFIFNSSLRYFLIAKFAGVKNIAQYPLFRSKDNIVISAKIFTENELNTIVSTQPNLILNSKKVLDAKSNFDPKFKHICLGISASGPTKRWDIENYILLCEKLNNYVPCIFYLAAGKKDKELVEKILSSKLGKKFISFENLRISETLPIIKNCDFCISNDTGWLHIASALGVKSLALFMDSPAVAYGKYSKNINIVIPDGESESSTTHNTLGKDRISVEKVFKSTIELLI